MVEDIILNCPKEGAQEWLSDRIDKALEDYAEKVVSERTKFLHGTVEMSVREQARNEGIEAAIEISDDYGDIGREIKHRLEALKRGGR